MAVNERDEHGTDWGEQKHTPEPWGFMSAGDGPESLVIVADRTSLLTIVREGDNAAGVIVIENGSKPCVACVNACAGVKQSTIEEMCVDGQGVQALLEFSMELEKTANSLRAQLAEARQQLATLGVVIQEIQKEPLL